MREICIYRAPGDPKAVVAHDNETGRAAFAHALDEGTNDFLTLSRIAVNRLAAMIEIDGGNHHDTNP
jgi:hypothetical protein